MNSTIHLYCVYRLSQMGLSQTAIAHKTQVSVPVVNQVIRGVRTSKKIQGAIATTLGHNSWSELEQTAILFQSLASMTFNKPKSPKRRLKDVG